MNYFQSSLQIAVHCSAPTMNSSLFGIISFPKRHHQARGHFWLWQIKMYASAMNYRPKKMSLHETDKLKTIKIRSANNDNEMPEFSHDSFRYTRSIVTVWSKYKYVFNERAI